MRRLIYIPILHTAADLGTLAGPIQQMAVADGDLATRERTQHAIERMWTEIREELTTWLLPYPQVRLYQDGLPIGDFAALIVNDLANAGSPNHQLLRTLMARGAILMGTESPALLLEEYSLIKQLLAAPGPEARQKLGELQQPLAKDVLKRRDAFIATRINETLLEGETGILFIGMLHSLRDLLAHDIELIFSIHLPGS